ncbi:MAG: hypothetical protein HYU53_04275 [Acidobacteria bacterium]|nr:hypothetical protein [Acidobacteriota bacterium]
MAARADKLHAAVAVFPELGLSGYSNEDLFHQDALLEARSTAATSWASREVPDGARATGRGLTEWRSPTQPGDQHMADTIRGVDYFYLTVPDKPGEGARVLNVLKEAGVNLLAFSGFPERRRTQLDFFPEDPAAFKQAAKRAKWRVVGPKRGFLVQGDDRVGAAAELLERLGAARINVTAIDAVSVNGRYGAIFWVAPKDVKKTAALLGAA